MADDSGTKVDVDAATLATATAAQRAPWLSRAGAFTIDVLFGVGTLAVAAVLMPAAQYGSGLWWVCVAMAAVVLLAIAVNRWVLPVVTGWTLGRALTGIVVVRADGGSVTPLPLLVRDLAHLLDTAALGVGWLWPLWDSRNRTFADLLVRTEVHRRRPAPERARRWTVMVVALAAAVAAATAALGYVVVYRHDFAIRQAKEQIAVQGPKMVEDMLGYDVASLQADFERAQSLVTDSYRPQLVAQQDAVRKAGAVDNEYWVTNSSVLSVTQDRATMLLLMQGQRGEPPKQRMISATVRVDYERSGDRWRVANLSVLAKPDGSGGGG
jgi:Mce-associated membrane protein